jgi:hypothetical protein
MRMMQPFHLILSFSADAQHCTVLFLGRDFLVGFDDKGRLRHPHPQFYVMAGI